MPKSVQMSQKKQGKGKWECARWRHCGVLGKVAAVSSIADIIPPWDQSTRWPQQFELVSLTFLFQLPWLAFSINDWIYSIRLQWSLAHPGAIWIFTVWSLVSIVKFPSRTVIWLPNSWETPHCRAHLKVLKWSGVCFKHMYHFLCNIHNRLQRAMTAQFEHQVVDYRKGLAEKWWGSNCSNHEVEEGPEFPEVTILPHTEKLLFLL